MATEVLKVREVRGNRNRASDLVVIIMLTGAPGGGRTNFGYKSGSVALTQLYQIKCLSPQSTGF